MLFFLFSTFQACSSDARYCEGSPAIECYKDGASFLHFKLYKDAEEKFKGACYLEHMPACNQLALMYLNVDEVKKDYSIISSLLQKSCEKSDADGCYNLGVMYDQGLYFQKDRTKALKLYTQSCEMSSVSGCYNAAVLCEKDAQCSSDRDFLEKSYKVSCDGDNHYACYNLAVLYKKEDSAKINSVLDGLDKGCINNYTKACHFLASLHVNNPHVQQDFGKAFRLYNKACNANLWESCSQVGLMYGSGHGVPFDEVKAEKYLTMSCSNGVEMACKAKRLFDK